MLPWGCCHVGMWLLLRLGQVHGTSLCSVMVSLTPCLSKNLTHDVRYCRSVCRFKLKRLQSATKGRQGKGNSKQGSRTTSIWSVLY